MSKFTTWCTPCPECDFRKHDSNNGSLIGPVFHEEGDKCPECNSEIRIRFRNQGSPLAYAEAEVVKK